MTFKYTNVNVISIIPKIIDIPIYRKFQYRVIGIYKKTIIIGISIYRNSLILTSELNLFTKFSIATPYSTSVSVPLYAITARGQLPRHIVRQFQSPYTPSPRGLSRISARQVALALASRFSRMLSFQIKDMEFTDSNLLFLFMYFCMIICFKTLENKISIEPEKISGKTYST